MHCRNYSLFSRGTHDLAREQYNICTNHYTFVFHLTGESLGLIKKNKYLGNGKKKKKLRKKEHAYPRQRDGKSPDKTNIS